MLRRSRRGHRHALTYALSAVLMALPALVVGQAAPQLSPTSQIPNDTAVTIGTLPNGMRYYIRANAKPAHRAEFRLVVKAGSLMEEADQLGGAHFIEHMAFRGTNHFQGTEIVEYLKSIGVAFGADLNANTSFERTIFILPLPTDTLAQVQRGLQILEDWAHGVTFPQKDMDEERGIILGERTSRLGAQQRIQEQQLPIMLKGSQYPDRLPIGTKESVSNMTRDALIRFYKKWYRPDRMAIIAIGDFDKAQMEQMIRDQFSKIPAATTPLAEPSYPVPSQLGTLVAQASDPEVTGTSVAMIYKGPEYEQNTPAAWRASLVRNIFDALLNQRLREITSKPDAPFLGASVSHGGFIGDVSAVSLGANVANGGATRGMQALLTEVARVAQHGFTQTELDRIKKNYLTSIENNYQNRASRTSGGFADAYINHFLKGSVVPSAETSASLQKELLAAITLADLQKEVEFFKQTDNRVLSITAPQKPDVVLPDSTALLALFKTAGTEPVTAYVDRVTDQALLPSLPTPGKVVSEKQFADVSITQWTLSNGATVLLKPTKFKEDEILFGGFKPGGASLFADTDYPTAAFLPSLVAVGGWGNFSVIDLGRQLTGKSAKVETSISATGERISGGSTGKDLETMLQLSYLQLTQPRYDSAAMTAALQRFRSSLANRAADPGAVFGDTVSVTLSRNSVRSPVVSEAVLDRLDLHRAVALYKDRFADAGRFTFMFVGAFSPDSIKPLVERYLGGLPALQRKEAPRDNPVYHSPKGVIRKTVVKGTDARTVTLIRISGAYESTPQNATDMQIMTQVLENRLQNKLREEMAGTYGVSVKASRSGKPISEYSISIQFISDPTHREELTKAAYAVIDSLKISPPSADELQRVTAPMLRSVERARETNGYWLSALSLYELGRPFSDLLDDNRVKSATPAQVQQAAKRYLNLENHQQFDLLPDPGARS